MVSYVKLEIRRFEFETRNVLNDAEKAREWLERFVDTLRFQELHENPMQYAIELVKESEEYRGNISKVRSEAAKKRWRKKNAQYERPKFGNEQPQQKTSQTDNEMSYYTEPNGNIGEQPKGFETIPIDQDIDITDYSDEHVNNMDVVEFAEAEPQKKAEFTFSSGHIGVSFSEEKKVQRISDGSKPPKTLNEVLCFCYENKMYDDEWVKWWFKENANNNWNMPDGKKINNWKSLIKKAFSTKERR